MDESGRLPSAAEELFAAALRSVQYDHEFRIDDLCEAHPQHDAELRACWNKLEHLKTALSWQTTGRIPADEPSTHGSGDITKRLREQTKQEGRYRLEGKSRGEAWEPSSGSGTLRSAGTSP